MNIRRYIVICAALLFPAALLARPEHKPLLVATGDPGSTEAATVPDSAQREPSAADPFARLRVVIPRDQLGPLRSVRLRNHDSDKDPTKRRRRNRVLVLTKPSGAKVYYRGKLLGVTPLTIDANGRTTPMDIVIRARGFMVLRTRIQRNERRTYAFQLTPSKFN